MSSFYDFARAALVKPLAYLGAMSLLAGCVATPNPGSSSAVSSSSTAAVSSVAPSSEPVSSSAVVPASSSSVAQSSSSVVMASSVSSVTSSVVSSKAASSSSPVPSSSVVPSSSPLSSVDSSSSASPAPETVYAINAGGEAFTAQSGIVFQADDFFEGGAVSTTADAVANTQDDALFQSTRWGQYRYSLPVDNGVYKVALYLNENFQTEAGKRVISIDVEGLPAVNALDLYASAGHDTALIVEQDGVGVTDGVLDIELSASVNNGIISGFTIMKSDADPIAPPQSSSSVASSSSGSSSSKPPYTGPVDITTAVQNGGWGKDETWDNGIPDDSKRAIIPQDRTVSLWGNGRLADGVVVHGELNIGEQENASFSLNTPWVHVNSNGLFRIGSKANPYDQGRFTLTLTGTNPTASWDIPMANGNEMTVSENNGFVMASMGGSLQFFGKKKLSFTRLAATAKVGDNKVYVRNIIERNYDGDYSEASDGALDWEVGDQIVIASSSMNYEHEEVRTITAITDLGNTNTEITLNNPLQYRHYSGRETYGPEGKKQTIEMRAEVALLSRNVKIQGLASQDTDASFGDRARFNAGTAQGVGGHIMAMGTAGAINLDSVQLHGMGQTGRLGRYPMHWHVAGDRKGDSLRGVSITNSNNRGVTVHGTHNLLIQDVVLHDIHGHGFFMEDAVETGNTYLSNIAFGIHKVGRSDAVGDKKPDGNDPFIVDTHDFVGQNPTRFLSSAAYWMTNPDNTWRGNISAGSEGTGFWFLFPSKPIGLAVGVAQYADVKPDQVNLREFNYNSTHSSPIGLNVDRGGDLEGEVGDTLLPNFNGNEYKPAVEPLFANFTGYKHTVAVYHRGRIGNFANNLFADNFNSTFLTFTQRITNALYVGHSQGNSDPNQIVTAHTFYDGANTLDGTHFAGFTANNAHMFRVAAIAGRHTHFVMRNTSYEDDGSADNMRFATEQGFAINNNNLKPLGKSAPSVLFDEDGTLTGHVGGKAGSTVIANHPYYYDSQDVKPQNWSVRVSDNRYALMRMANFGGSDTTFRVTTADGDKASDKPGAGQFAASNALVKINGGDYTVDFPDGLNTVSGGFDIQFYIATGPRGGSTVVKFAGIGNGHKVGNRTKVDNLNAVRNATQTSWAQVGNDIWIKFFTTEQVWLKTQFRPQ